MSSQRSARAHTNVWVMGCMRMLTDTVSLRLQISSRCACYKHTGKPLFIQCGYWEELCSPYAVLNPSPTLDKNLASMGPGIVSSVGVGVWNKAPEALPDSNTILDTFQSVMYTTGMLVMQHSLTHNLGGGGLYTRQG